MKKALLYIVSSIIENPQKVEVTEEEQDDVINLTLKVEKADMGKVIGKNGKIIRAIRNIMKINAIKENKKINITLVENPT